MSRPPDPRTAHIVTSYADTVRALRERITAFVTAVWGSLGTYHDADIARFVKQVTPVVAGGQRQVASLTDAYLASVGTTILGKPQRPIGIPSKIITPEALRGVDAKTLYTRPGVTVWTALSNGVPFDAAVAQGLTRATTIVGTDLQLARTHASQYAMNASGNIVGYQRVPGGGNVCDLCELASTQRYHSGDLMPIHNGCSCGIEPIFGTEDPGQVINPDLLDDINSRNQDDTEDAGDQVGVEQHGELGPVLVVAGQNFTGPDDLDS